jgi:hypothetical protein
LAVPQPRWLIHEHHRVPVPLYTHSGSNIRRFSGRSPAHPLRTSCTTTDRPLHPILDPLDPTSSLVPPSTSLPTALTLPVNPTPAHRRLFPDANPLRRGQASPVSFFLPATPNLVHRPATLLPGASPLHLVTGSRWNSAGPPSTGTMGASSPASGPGPNGQVGPKSLSWAGLKTPMGRAQGNSAISFFLQINSNSVQIKFKLLNFIGI